MAVAQNSSKTSGQYIIRNTAHPESIVEGPSYDFFNASKSNKKIPHTSKTLDNSNVNVIDLGQAANVFGMAFGGKTFLWADPNLNTISLTHRSDFKSNGDGSSGWLRFDYSTDGGINWLLNKGPVYKSNNSSAPPFADARYPEGLLYNPSGNTTPDSLFLTYFAPSLTSTNGLWGGVVHGTAVIGKPATYTRKEEVTNRTVIPDAMTLTQTGVVYVVDFAEDDANTTTPIGYKDSVYVWKGIWNSSKRDFDYTKSKFYAPVSKDNKGRANSNGVGEIAFADDGNNGYFSMIGHSSFKSEPDSISSLIVYKTTNGGTSWSPSKIISMDGAKSLLPASTQTKFTAGFEEDAVVDSKGNLHVIIPISEEIPNSAVGFSVNGKAGLFGIFDVYTTDGGTNWRAKLLGNPQTLAATFGVSASDVTNPNVVEYNRVQASRSHDGTKLFFTWFDTDTASFHPVDGNHANMNPNAFVMAYDVVRDLWTSTPTSTFGTPASDVVTFGSTSYYVFENAGTYTVPIVYMELAGSDPTKTGSPVQFHYIDGLTFVDGDFTDAGNSVPLTVIAAVNEKPEVKGLELSQNYPNPFHNSTSFNLTLTKSSVVNVEVYNMIGQNVSGLDSKTYPAGTHAITIDGSNLTPGIYFYSVKTNDASLTQRMIVK